MVQRKQFARKNSYRKKNRWRINVTILLYPQKVLVKLGDIARVVDSAAVQNEY
mgnify:CR=1 FL=1